MWPWSGQLQANKTKLENKQQQNQNYVNDACGRILAEAEALIKAEFPNYEGRHGQYLTVKDKDQSFTKRMTNIQTYLKMVKEYCKENKEAASENIHTVSIPHPGPRTILELVSAFKQVNDPTLRKVLLHLVIGFESGTLDVFPEDLYDEILSSLGRKTVFIVILKHPRVIVFVNANTSTAEMNEATDNKKTSRPMIPSEPLSNSNS